MTWIRRLTPVLVAAALLVGCSSSPSTTTTSSNGSGTGHCKPCVVFKLQVNFTGLDNVQGSFVDVESGTGFSSCAEFAKGDSVGFVQGPGTDNRPATVIGGKTVNFLFYVSKEKFHGPGTYTGALAAGVTIGADTFLVFSNSDSSETLNADGSGHGSFSNLQGGSSTTSGTESGTVSWTCS